MRTQRNSECGTTILEVAISTALFLVVLLPLATLSLSATGTFHEVAALAGAESSARRAADRLTTLLGGVTDASVTSMAADPIWASDLTFDRVETVDLTNGNTTDRPVRIRWTLDATEADNGLDDDGDGRIDFPEDLNCKRPDWNRERPKRCGLGFEGSFVVAALALWRARRRRSQTA